METMLPVARSEVTCQALVVALLSYRSLAVASPVKLRRYKRSNRSKTCSMVSIGTPSFRSCCSRSRLKKVKYILLLTKATRLSRL